MNMELWQDIYPLIIYTVAFPALILTIAGITEIVSHICERIFDPEQEALNFVNNNCKR